MLKKFLIIFLFGIIFFLTKVDSSYAQACAAPATPTGVTVEYPGCNGESCDLTTASCAWSTQADAASFNVTVTEVETGTIIINNASQTSSTAKVSFAITQGRTYKCDVVAVSSCGGLSAAGTDQLLCEADAIIDTPTPVPPTATPVPPTATPTIEPPGSIFQTVSIIGGIAILLVGGFLLFVL